jgi:hypothetical protein
MTIFAAVPISSVFWKRHPTSAPLVPTPPVEKPENIRCIAVSPGVFTVPPGGKRDLTAHFWGRGQLTFAWSATGGVLTTFNGQPGQPTLAGYAYLDDFEDGAIDEQFWKEDVPNGATLVEKNGVLRMRVESGSHDAVTRLETKPELVGDFGVQLTVRAVGAEQNRGAAALSFVSSDGHEAHVQAMAGKGFFAVEANAKNPQGVWRPSTHAVYAGGPVLLRLVRIGSTISTDYDLGGGYLPLGNFEHVSSAPGRLRLETWSLDGHPAVDVEFDNFGAARNTIIAWQAPNDAAPGSSFVVKLQEGCQTTARIGQPGTTE